MRKDEMPELIGDMLLMNGCTERQMKAIDNILEWMEKNAGAVHLSIVGMRAAAHCGMQSAKDADAAHWLSNSIRDHLAEQRNSLAGLVGRTKAELN